MKTRIVFYIALLCSFLFACGDNENITEDVVTESSAAEEIVQTSYYQDIIKNAKCANIPRPADTYIYPCVPGTKEWKSLHNKGIDEVIKACIVPAGVLKKLSTQGVIQTYFDYPFLLDMYASSSTLLNGHKHGAQHNRAYAELYKRKDAGKCLLERYIPFNPVGYDAAMSMGQQLEIVLAQPEFYSQLNADEKLQLVKAALQKIEMRVANDFACINENQVTTLLIGRVMVSAEFEPFVKEVENNKLLAQYLETQDGEFNDYDLIISYAYQFVK